MKNILVNAVNYRIKPTDEILMQTVTGILTPGQDEIKLKCRPMTIIEVTAGDKVLSQVEG